jgi:phosphocarrier protein HPr
MDRMNEIEIKEAIAPVVNRAGLHARPAAALVKLAGRFLSEIHVEKDGLRVNGKSIMGVLMLAAEQGSSLRFTASGPDADDALSALTDLVRRGFEED